MSLIQVLNQKEVAQVTSLDNVIRCVEDVYVQNCLGKTVVWPTTFYEFSPGVADMDIKSGYLKNMGIFGHKTVSWFGPNSQLGIPELTGAIMLFSAKTGMPVGLLDAAFITGIRTGAAGAIGAKYLARPDSRHLLVVGCGNQAFFQIAAMLTLFPALETITVANPRCLSHAQDFVASLPKRLEETFSLTCPATSLRAVQSPKEALQTSDIVITATSSKEPLIKRDWVRPGTHFSCIGADAEGKEELDPLLFEHARIFVDDPVHCIAAGEIEIPLKKGIISKESITGEIGELICQKKAGRTDSREITVFDATGMAILDLAVAKATLDAAKAQGLGQTITL